MLDGVINIIISCFQVVFDFFESFTIFGVSVIWYIVACFVIGLLITAVVNVVRQPATFDNYSRRHKKER